LPFPTGKNARVGQRAIQAHFGRSSAIRGDCDLRRGGRKLTTHACEMHRHALTVLA